MLMLLHYGTRLSLTTAPLVDELTMEDKRSLLSGGIVRAILVIALTWGANLLWSDLNQPTRYSYTPRSVRCAHERRGPAASCAQRTLRRGAVMQCTNLLWFDLDTRTPSVFQDWAVMRSSSARMPSSRAVTSAALSNSLAFSLSPN